MLVNLTEKQIKLLRELVVSERIKLEMYTALPGSRLKLEPSELQRAASYEYQELLSALRVD